MGELSLDRAATQGRAPKQDQTRTISSTLFF